VQRGVISLFRQMPIDLIVAKIGLSAAKPASEGWPSKITDLMEGFVPKNAFGLFSPELITLREGSATKRQGLLR